MEIRESQAVQYNRPNIGQLVNTVIRSHVIGEA